MNLSLNEKTERVTDYLLHLCHEHGVFPPEIQQCNPTDDLIESGLIDSMGLMYIQGIILEKFSIDLKLELFIAELRTIQSIASYLTKQLKTEWFETHHNCMVKAAALKLVGGNK